MSPLALDADACYRASAGRDKRFDGQFVMAVRTTGIYCKPSCPARMPKPAHVVFYRTSAAAHVAGFRACKRCLPEAVPGSPEWSIREDVAGRAMRLIADGLVDREGVPGLAARLGYSERHLARVLTEELGAPPLALARAQRAQTARQLLVTTAMPAADVAFAAGFQSIRQFNDTIVEVFGMTPTALRATARRADAPAGTGTPGAITVRLAAREPFDGDGVLAWLAARAIPGIEEVEGGAYTRSVRLPGGPAVVTVTPEHAAVRVTARLTSLADLPALLARVRRLFDLDADPAAYDDALAAASLDANAERLVNALAAAPGLRIAGTLEPTEMVVRAILGQQVSVAAARTAVSRLAAALSEPLADGRVVSPQRARNPPTGRVVSPRGEEGGTGSVTHLFPTAEAIAAAARSIVTGPATRREALALAAEAIAQGTIRLDQGTTRDDLTHSLEAIPGIGPWTSHYVALRVLGSPDILLTGDIAVRNGAAALGLPSDPKALAAASAAFSPWRSYVMMHLWRAATPTPPALTNPKDTTP